MLPLQKEQGKGVDSEVPTPSKAHGLKMREIW
jgi:hypothetical protein